MIHDQANREIGRLPMNKLPVHNQSEELTTRRPSCVLDLRVTSAFITFFHQLDTLISFQVKPQWFTSQWCNNIDKHRIGFDFISLNHSQFSRNFFLVSVHSTEQYVGFVRPEWMQVYALTLRRCFGRGWCFSLSWPVAFVAHIWWSNFAAEPELTALSVFRPNASTMTVPLV